MNSNFSLMELFREEVRSHTATLSAGLLELESDVSDPKKMEPLMRGAHSIKGAARIVGIELAVRLAHVMEDALVAAQEGKIQLTSTDIDLLLQGTDILAELQSIDESTVTNWSNSNSDRVQQLATQLEAVKRGEKITKTESSSPTIQSVPPEPVPTKPEIRLPRIIPTIPAEPLATSDDPTMMDLFREEVRLNGRILCEELPRFDTSILTEKEIEPLIESAKAITGASRIVGQQAIAGVGEAIQVTLLQVRDRKTSLSPLAVDILIRAISIFAEVIPLDDEEVLVWIESNTPRLIEIREEILRIPQQSPTTLSVAPSVNQDDSPTELIVESSPEPKQLVRQSVPSKQSTTPPSSTPVPQTNVQPAEAVVRVTAQSLNRLMGLAGESLVQARWLQPFATSLQKLKKYHDHLSGLLELLEQSLVNERDSDQTSRFVADARRQATVCRQVLSERMSEFEDHTARAEDLNSRLYREVIVSRMRPFADGAHGFPRLVRDMARSLDKQVKFEMIGSSTEVDSDILDKLEAPLTHLLRNAVDHGIETAEQRRQTTKPEVATIRIETRHRAGMLAITVSDDGRGVDIEKLRKVVVERKLTTQEMAKSLSEAELLEFLFLPGFSTAKSVSEYSGRGVGLDVVHDTIRKIGGNVRISTALGKGTQFHLQLPITLSVLRAVIVTIAGEPYAFPHNRIDRLVRILRQEVHSLEGRQFVTIDGQNLGLVLAGQILELSTESLNSEELTVVLVSDTTGHYGLIVDAFRGEQDLVVRPLDPRLGKVPNISAAAILDDGMPVLILDVEDLIRSTDQYIQTGSLRRFEKHHALERPRKRILVVDDSITVREVERQILRTHGYDVSVAVDGQEGWNTVRSEQFDLVVSDVDMPRMNGLDLVRAIRAESGLRDLPVIIVSYKERQEDRMRGLEVGANRYLTKSSFHDNSFLQAVADLIGEP